MRRLPTYDRVACRIMAHRDRGTKQQIYHRAGVTHCWLLDPYKRALTVLQRAEHGYVVLLSARRV